MPKKTDDTVSIRVSRRAWERLKKLAIKERTMIRVIDRLLNISTNR